MSISTSASGTESVLPQGDTAEATQSRFESLLSLEEDRQPSKAEKPVKSKQELPADDEPEPETPEVDEDQPNDGEDGESQPDDEPEGDEVEEPQVFTVKINGEEVKVTLDEALKGYSRTQDYTRKTQELAQRLKEFEPERNAVRAERQQYADALRQVEQALTDLTPQEPDWVKVQHETPEDFPILWAQWQQHKERLSRLSAERRQAEESVRADQIAAYNESVQRAQEQLFEQLPEWKDAEKRKAEQTRLRSYAVENAGYTEDELNSVVDPRAIVLLRKAMLYDEAQKAKPVLKQKIEKIKKATPGSAHAKRQVVAESTKALQRLAKTGRVEDAASAFELMLPD